MRTNQLFDAIREATASDVPALVDFGQQVSHDTYVKTGFLPAAYVNKTQRGFWSTDYLSKVIEAKETILLVAYDQDELIGMTEVQLLNEQEAVMWKLYVRQTHHGRGLGRRLLQEISGRLPTSIQLLKTEYYESNTPAAGFYQTQGFKFLERKEESFADDTIPYIFVSKDIRQK